MEAVEGLIASTSERFEKIWDLNEKKIQLKCGEVQRLLEVISLKLHDYKGNVSII